MAAHPRPLGRRLGAVALATGTLAAAGAGTAGAVAPAAGTPHATTTTTTTQFRGATDANVVSLALGGATVDLTPLGFGNPVTLNLISATGRAAQVTGAAPVSTSTGALASGTLTTNALGAALNQAATATLTNPTASAGGMAVPSNPLGLTLSVAPLAANVDTVKDGNTSSGSVATGALGSLASIPGLGPVVTMLTGALTPLTDGITTASTALGGALAGVASNVPVITVPGMTIANPITGAPIVIPPISSGSVTGLTGTITDLGPDVTALINQLTTGPLVSLDGVSASQAITPDSTIGTVSTAKANLADIKLLGGLLSISSKSGGALSGQVTATATGTPGKASSTASSTLAEVSVNTTGPLGTLLDAAISDQGIVAQIASQTALGPTVTGAATTLGTQLQSLISQLVNLTGMLGVTVTPSATTQSTSADGTHAEAHASGILLNLAPPGIGQLLTLRVGAADATADFSRATTTTMTTATVPKKVTRPRTVATPVKKLAFTGADLPLTGGLGLLLVGGAALALRRRHPVEAPLDES